MFRINAETLPPSEAFTYLRWTITYNNSNCLVVYHNLRKELSWWGMITRVLESTGSIVRERRMMYKAVSQLVLLYVSESWVVKGEILYVLEWFHHWAARRIMRMTATCGAGGE